MAAKKPETVKIDVEKTRRELAALQARIAGMGQRAAGSSSSSVHKPKPKKSK